MMLLEFFQNEVRPQDLLDGRPDSQKVLSLGDDENSALVTSIALQLGHDVTILGRRAEQPSAMMTGLKGARYLNANLETWLPVELYDIILAYHVLQSLNHDYVLEVLLYFLSTHLRPGGTLDIVVPACRDSRPALSRYGRLEIVRALEIAGLISFCQHVRWLVEERSGETERTHVVWVRAQRPRIS